MGFGGWEMPLSYPLGTLQEHQACRRDAAMFDVSHLGTVRVVGDGAFDRLQQVLTNDLGRIGPGRAQYTHLLDANDASVLDDIIVWWIDNSTFDVMPNASNTDRVVKAIGGTDTTSQRVVIAVQGPHSRDKVSTFWPEAGAVGRFRVQQLTFHGATCVVAGTGYTGEDGIEIAAPIAIAETLWNHLLHAGVTPAGLGARDTLRLEAGLPLHGHELGVGITPLHANLEWVVSWTKGDFVGRDALLAVKSHGINKKLHGISIDGRRPAREGTPVLSVDGELLGSVTSGNFSPSLGCCIALSFLTKNYEIGDSVVLDIRGTHVAGTISALPFVK